MRLSRSLALCLTVALVAIFGSLDARAQNLHNYSVNLFGGIGGAFDVEPDAGLDNTSLQLGFSLITGPRNSLGFRLGQIDFSGPEGFAASSEADLTYLTVGGEFRSQKSFFDSGIYLALGGYQVEGTEGRDDSSFGLAIGSTADFPINRWVSVLAELSGHLTDLDDAQFFGMLHLGVSVRF